MLQIEWRHLESVLTETQGGVKSNAKYYGQSKQGNLPKEK